MRNLFTWKFISRSLEQNTPVMLLYVLESKGSSPGRQGFLMAINVRNEMEGSIGGGIMEHKFVEMAKESLEPGAGGRVSAAGVRKQFHDKSASRDRSGMICSGEQTILLYRVKENDLKTVRDIIRSLEQHKNGILILSPGKMEFKDAVAEIDFEYSFQSEDNWLYQEKTGYKNNLFIIGGGHCALALSKLMGTMDFFTRVYDERKDLKTMKENDAAHEKHSVSDYSELKEIIPPGGNHYVVIMTFGYRTDDLALRALLGKDFKYIGLLGSKYKVGKMLKDYRKEGIKEQWLQAVHTPIGIGIKSQTPEEIAVSIAAEIIQIKNQYL
jgi:xanthine dehydrogenase accessory factor